MRVRRVIATLAVAGTGFALAAPAASGHTELTSTTPKAGSYAKRTLSEVRARFSQPIRSGRLEVFRAGKKVSTGPGRRSARNLAAIEARIDEELEGGRYVARWTMTAADGHVQKGSWRFRVRPQPAAARTEEQTEAAPATPAETASPPAAAQPATTAQPVSAADDGGSGAWIAAGAAVVALVVVGAVGVRRRRALTGASRS